MSRTQSESDSVNHPGQLSCTAVNGPRISFHTLVDNGELILKFKLQKLYKAHRLFGIQRRWSSTTAKQHWQRQHWPKFSSLIPTTTPEFNSQKMIQPIKSDFVFFNPVPLVQCSSDKFNSVQSSKFQPFPLCLLFDDGIHCFSHSLNWEHLKPDQSLVTKLNPTN